MNKVFNNLKNTLTNYNEYNNIDIRSGLHSPKIKLTKLFYIIALIHIVVVILQALEVFHHDKRVILSITEIILSISLSYRFGYYGMSLSIITNSLAAFKMFNFSRVISSVIESSGGNINVDLLEITNIVPSLFINMAVVRISLIIISILAAYISEQGNKYINKLKWIASIDGVTGVYNHRYFQSILEEEIKKSKESNSSLGMMMIDLDNFKLFNDTYGHKAGDELLNEAAKVFMSKTRKQDIICRYGGDEFAILIPDTTNKDILLVIERIRDSFNQMINSQGFNRLSDKTSLSVGYSIYPDFAKTKDQLIIQADSALYQAKNMGRNNVQLYRNVFEDIKASFNSDENQLLGGVRALLGTVSAKDKYTLGHSERVMDYAVKIGRLMNLNNIRLRSLKLAALLHDIGKVEISENILNKSEPLTDEEFYLLRKHPSYSVDILEPLSNLELLIDTIMYHHERFDGKGYPTGIKGNNIPLEARILCVADAFDAMLSDRPYRKGMRLDEVTSELLKNSGTQFDPDVVQVLLKIIKETKVAI
ncbi:UNVERIFIED_CONTAM: diguanylate cyclase (GGDEF)-like protein [Acetivibrio alkalicellulosi]